jgi:hypothetical protein
MVRTYLRGQTPLLATRQQMMDGIQLVVRSRSTQRRWARALAGGPLAGWQR